MLNSKKNRLIVAITGASGAIYGIKALESLQGLEVESHLVLSKSAERTILHETSYKVADVKALADVVYPQADIGAAIASGSFKTMGMLVAPCSVKTMGEIAACITQNLVSRAADVVLKERRKLVLLLRETPLHAGHIRLMADVTQSGAIVMPPVPAFYTNPQTIDDMVTDTVTRALDLFDIEVPAIKRWDGKQAQ